MITPLSIDYGRHDDMDTPRDPGDYVGRHCDRGSRNPGPFAYLGVDGSLFRVWYRSDGYTRVYRAEYGLAATMIENGEVFE